jgi:hypothetical protein
LYNSLQTTVKEGGTIVNRGESPDAVDYVKDQPKFI